MSKEFKNELLAEYGKYLAELKVELAIELYLDNKTENRIADSINLLPDHILILAYTRFCNIQAANWLIPKKPEIDRFLKWYKTGSDLDAWA